MANARGLGHSEIEGCIRSQKKLSGKIVGGHNVDPELLAVGTRLNGGRMNEIFEGSTQRGLPSRMNTTATPIIESSSPATGASADHTVVIRPSKVFSKLDLVELWKFRELFYFLVWRDVKIRYKQTVIGAAWAIVQPVMTMVVFTVIFGNFAQIPSDGLPYSIFSYTALLPWNYFSQAIARSGNSLVGDSNLVRKVYFPRLIIPLASVSSPLVDFFVSFLVLLAMLAWFGIAPGWGVLVLPLFLVLAFMMALAVGLWLSPLNARYRDISYAIPFLIQLWMYASPVVYSVSMVPEKWRPIFSLNPLAGVIEGFRWALLGKGDPAIGAIMLSACVVLMLLLGGMFFFKRMERYFADVL
jgi:lipopolysaccharide transport system permease protein